MKRDRRLAGIVLTVSAVLLIGGLVAFAPDEPPPISDKVSADKQTTEPAADPRLDPSAHQQQAKKAEIKHRFDQAIAMLVEWSRAHPEHDSMEAIDGVLQWAAETYPCE